jgi:hypothetical protein
MSLLTFSINLDTIASPTLDKICHFDPTQVDHLAHLFLLAGDTVRPIILRKISPVKFEVLEGYFEYYAAMKAQEIDDQFTAIQAHVVSPDLESTILEQYNFLRSPSTAVPQAQPDLAQNLAQMETAIANRLEQKLSTTIDRIVEERINSSLQVFANQITQQLNSHLLDFKQSLSLVPLSQVLSPNPAIASAPESATKKTAKSKTPKAIIPKPEATISKSKAKNTLINNDDPKVLQVLHDLNTMNFADLERKLAQLKPSKRSLAKPIYQERSFQSVEDVMNKVAGIKDVTMQKIIDAW